MRKRDIGSAPAIGDRVAYVIIKGTKGSVVALTVAGAQAYEKSEDPIYVLENNVPIDTRYYLDNQLRNPLTRIFEPILGSKTDSLCNLLLLNIVHGNHTRSVSVLAPTLGGLMKYTVKTKTCMGCKTPFRKGGNLIR